MLTFRALTIIAHPEGYEYIPLAGEPFEVRKAVGFIAVMPDFKGISRDKTAEIFEDVVSSVPVHKIILSNFRSGRAEITPNQHFTFLHNYLLACLNGEGVEMVNGGKLSTGPNYQPTFTEIDQQHTARESIHDVNTVTVVRNEADRSWVVEGHFPFHE